MGLIRDNHLSRFLAGAGGYLYLVGVNLGDSRALGSFVWKPVQRFVCFIAFRSQAAPELGKQGVRIKGWMTWFWTNHKMPMSLF